MNEDQLEKIKDAIDRLARQQQRQFEQPDLSVSIDRALGKVAADLLWWGPRVILGVMILYLLGDIVGLVLWLNPESRIGVAEQSVVVSDTFETDKIHGTEFRPPVPDMVNLHCPMQGKVVSIVKVGTHVEPDTIICTIESEERNNWLPSMPITLTSRYEAGVTGEVIAAQAGEGSSYPRFKINTAKPGERKKPAVKLKVEEPQRPVDAEPQRSVENVFPVIPDLSKPDAKPTQDDGRWTIYGLPETKPEVKPESKPVPAKSETDPEFEKFFPLWKLDQQQRDR